jgi:hypothetical protein
MKTRSALRVAAIILIGLVTLGQPIASADKVKVEEFYGTGFRVANVTMTRETLATCDDTDPNTNVVLQTNTGTATYTGIMDGIGQTTAKVIVDSCVPGHTHTTFRAVETFDNLTVAGRTGGAVVEFLGNGRIVPIPPGPTTTATLNETRIRILCGTGDLKRVHAEGTLTASVRAGSQSRAMQVWAHFGHNHNVGFDFLCQDLEGNNSNQQ